MNSEAKKRYKEIDFPFTCLVTNRVFETSQGLSCYVTKTLKMDHREYYDHHIHHRTPDCFFCGNRGVFISISRGYRNLCDNPDCVRKSFSSHSVEGFMYRTGCDREVAEKMFESENKRQLEERVKTQNRIRKTDPLWDKKRSRNCIEFWINKGLTVEQAELRVKEVMDEIHKKTSEKLKSNPEKYASKYPTKVEYYLKRGFSEEEAKSKISEIQNRFSLKSCIEKYDKTKGMEVWQERQIKWMNTMDKKSESEKLDILKRKSSYCKKNYSRVSQKLFWEIYKKLENKETIFFKELNSEYVLFGEKTFIYDFIDVSSKKIIEFNGDYWHCNPEKYHENYFHTHLKMYAKERWKNDENRKRITESMGYNILVIWESEYRKSPQQILEKCIKFIND